MKADAPIAPHGEDTADNTLAKEWNDLDWNRIKEHVSGMQSRISKATKLGQNDRVKRLSYLLTHSFDAKALAVKKVTSNRGKRTPGVDGILWLKPEDKMNAVKTLSGKGYRAKPLRRIYIPKSNGKLRPLSIPTMYDRAMQALYALALDPIAEAKGDPSSFGFRIGRCAQDAAESIHACMNSKCNREWVMETDIKSCFDGISHEYIMENIPMDKKVLGQFLKAGFVYRHKMFPTGEGVPQGGVISPIIANMVLDGLEKALAEQFPAKRKRQAARARLIRYADDSICACSTKEIAEECKIITREFMAQRGLEISEEKTVITNITDGFDFLGFNFRKRHGHLLVTPSKKSVKRLLKGLHELILEDGLAISQGELIKAINLKIVGWGNYHKHNCSKKCFHDIDHILWQMLWRWARRRHMNKGAGWLRNRYWKTINGKPWVFTDGKETLVFLADVPIKRHIPLKRTMNPYIDKEYFTRRREMIRKAERKFRPRIVSPSDKRVVHTVRAV